MRAISRWAKRNPIKSRFLITGLHLLNIPISLLLGVLLYQQDWPVSSVAPMVLTIVLFAAYLFRPKATDRLTNSKYKRQKISDFTLVFASTLFIAFTVNNYLASPEDISLAEEVGMQTSVQMSAIGRPSDAEVLPAPTKSDIRKARRSQIKEIKAGIKSWKKARKGNKKGSDAGEVLLILLVILGAAALALLLAALACSLACSGAGALALLLMVAGVAGIIVLSVVLIKGIVGAKGPPARSVQ